VKILICDDHKIVREGLKQILCQLGDGTLLEEAGDGNEALSILKGQRFDIMLLDISLPGMNGIEVLQKAKDRHPDLNVLMLSMMPQEQYAILALKLGASGYLTKDTASDELLLAIRKISEGGKYISHTLAESLASHLTNSSDKKKHELLSGREFEIMLKLATGKTLLEISNELFISDKTVSTYRSRILEKMEFSKNAELTRYCLENKLI
jgi:Response regulator containing a CheY-like receiver domain and an HTH DNA-binding domain